MDSGWDDSSSSDWSGRSQDWGWTGQNHNWETDSSQSERSWKSEESSTSWRSAQSEQRQTLRAGRDRGDQAAELYPGRGEGVGVYAGDWGTSSVGLPVQRAAGFTVPPGQPSSEQESDPEGNGQLPSPMSPAAHMTEAWNKPSGNIPSGQPSVAGGSGATSKEGVTRENVATGKISTTYPPIFYARPGESWEQYWRTVTFWLASEGKSLPIEMRGPRLMQQLRERAGKIVQHLTVEQVTSSEGVELIKQEMERSPIIRLLDNKKIDKRRQKFMKLARLPNERIESFINRAEIYRRENETSPAYRVGSCFYVGHLLDSAKLTRKDLALLKAACGGDVEDENKVISALLELAEQFEGAAQCPIGRGEPQLDNEDQYLIQKPGSCSSTPTTSSEPSAARRRFFPRGRGGGRFPRRRFRDALMAIVEEDDEEALPDELLEMLGEDSLEEDEEKNEQQDMTEFAAAPHEAFVTNQPESSTGTSPLAEIYAQEYKARNRVREIKKMRQYFQKESPGGPTAARNEHVKKWVAEQQKKEPCFICHQLGHWSQECPYRKKVHSANVTFPLSRPQQEDWALLESLAAAGVYMVRDGQDESTLPHQVFWALDELDGKDHTKMIVDLGCMRTVAGTTWVNRVVQKWKRLKRYLKVVPEGEKFRFGDGQVVDSQFAVILEVDIAGIQALLRISVVHGNCPPLLSKPVCSELGLVIDTASHSITSRRYGVKQFGLEQSKGGHYVIPIDEAGIEGRFSIDPDFEWNEDKEICVLAGAIGSAIRDGTCDGPDASDCLAPATHGPERERQTGGLRVVAERMGDRWRWPGGRRGRARADGGRTGIGGEDPASISSQERNLQDGQEAYVAESTGQEIREDRSSSRGITGEDEGDGCRVIERADGHGQDASHVRPDATMDDAAEIVAGGRGSGGRREAFQARAKQRAHATVGEGQEDAAGSSDGGPDGRRGPVPVAVDSVLSGSHHEPHAEPQVPDAGVQVEAHLAAAASEGCSGGGPQEEMEAQSTMGHEDARQPHRVTLGSPRVSALAVLLPQGGLARTVEETHSGGGGYELANDPVSEEEDAGAAFVTANDPPEEYNMTMVDDDETGEFGRALNDELRSPVTSAAAPSFRKPLNRRQTRTIQQGVQRALQTHDKDV